MRDTVLRGLFADTALLARIRKRSAQSLSRLESEPGGPDLDVLADDGLHLLDLAAGSALGGGGHAVDHLDHAVLRQAGAVGAVRPPAHVLDDLVLGRVRHLAPVLAGAFDLLPDLVLGTVVDADGEDVRGQEEDGEEEDLDVEHLDGW